MSSEAAEGRGGSRRSQGLSSEGPPTVRPTLFRALGASDPPPLIEIGGISCRRVSVLKHDSWAATALYVDGSGGRAVCKFNRRAPLIWMPMIWLGRRLARREEKVLRLMQDVEGFPRWAGPVRADGRVLPYAVAHHWIDGQPFKPWLRVDDEFFPRLRAMLLALHGRDIAYVDMSKWENILVGDDGRPYLLDYQIRFELPRRLPLRWWLRWLQAADLYYLHRHWVRARPDQFTPRERERLARQPGFVRVGERVGAAWRAFRLAVLRRFGVRGDPRHGEESPK